MPVEYTLDTLHRTIDSFIKERDALAAELEQFKDEALEWEKAYILAESRVKALGARIRKLETVISQLVPENERENVGLSVGSLKALQRMVASQSDAAEKHG